MTAHTVKMSAPKLLRAVHAELSLHAEGQEISEIDLFLTAQHLIDAAQRPSDDDSVFSEIDCVSSKSVRRYPGYYSQEVDCAFDKMQPQIWKHEKVLWLDESDPERFCDPASAIINSPCLGIM